MRIFLTVLYCFSLLGALAAQQTPAPPIAIGAPPTLATDSIFTLAKEKYLQAATTLDTAAGLPRNAWDDGTWRQVNREDWTSGFFPGILWQIYAYDRDSAVLTQAAKWTETLRQNQTFDRNHDIGFIMYSSFGKALELTGDTATYLQPLLTAARTGAGRFNPTTETIRSWDRADTNHLTIVDNMMNLHLYTFAARETGDSSYLEMVRAHADRTDVEHFRPDGSSYHVVDYNPADGSVRSRYTHQGKGDETAWARGQAWAIYGFTEMYQDLGEQRYLDRAVSAADYFIENLPADTIPFWDFDAPGEERDASAAAIAASAFFPLSEATGDTTYRRVAERLLLALSSPEYLTGTDNPVGGLLRHQTGNKPRMLNNGEDARVAEVDVNINYGDYYYLEALNRYAGTALSPRMGNTNIRMARRDGEEWVALNEATRDPDHLGQIMPPVYQSEGPMWENENVGFRLYFDERNGIDVFGKRTGEMVLDRVGIDEDYHQLQDWGMDVLKVGNSLGAGSIGLMIGDSVYRLGDAAAENFRILEETPERSRFLLDYDGWEVAGRTLDLDWEISIEAGTYGYESSVTLTGLRGDEELLTGIVNLHSDTVYTEQRGDRFVLYTYGPQAELDHTLGMAVSVEQGEVLGQGEFMPDDTPIGSTYYVRLKLADGQPTTYRFTAGWEPGNADFGTREGFARVIE